MATDHAIAAIAERQGGIIAHSQLRGLGLSSAGIHRRVAAGRLHTKYRGVFAVGHRKVGADGLWWAAVLACGPDAVVSPITTPARTLLDLAAAGLRGRRLEVAVDRAERQRLLDFADLHRLLARYPRRAGSPALRAVLARYSAVDTRSELEDLVVELCDAHGLPRPVENCVIEGEVRDFYWPRSRLVVESDSYSWHRSPSALNDDRERDVTLTLAGYWTLRFTWEQVTRRRKYVADAILQGLSRLDLG